MKSNKIKENLKIVHFSDVHLGKGTSDKFLNDLVISINNQIPDVVIFTGDLFDNYNNDLEFFEEKEDFIIEKLSEIESLYGKFAIIGNHDCNSKETLEYYKELLEKSGFILLEGTELENYSYMINDLNLNLFGVNTSNKKEFDKVLENEKSREYLNLLLLHAPDYIDNLYIDSIDLAFAGHTHGGQVNIPYFKDFILPKGGQKYIQGEYDITDNTKLFVNTGIGTTRLPIRFLVNPKISVYNISKIN